MVRTTNAAAKHAAEAARQESLRKRAARQASKKDIEPAQLEVVECTVLPQGHEKISMGEHVPGLGEAHYEEGETFRVALPIALENYRRGYVNFEGAREAYEADEARRRAIAQQELADKLALQKAMERAGL